MKILFIIFILFLLSVSSAYAWDWDTHKYLADRVCNDFNCGCFGEIEQGSIYPDETLNDQINHHCYNPTLCEPSIYYTCPTTSSCPAAEKMQEYFDKVQYDSGCQKWFDVGVASHYFFDMLNPWHQVQDEDYDRCHKPFEDQVGEKIKSGAASWNVTVCGKTVYSYDLDTYIKEFDVYTSQQIQQSVVTSNSLGNSSLNDTVNSAGDVVAEGIDIANRIKNKGADYIDKGLDIAGWHPTPGQFIIGLLVIMAIAAVISIFMGHWHALLGIIIIAVVLILILKYIFGISVPFI